MIKFNKLINLNSSSIKRYLSTSSSSSTTTSSTTTTTSTTKSRNLILGIESSCDDTCAAILNTNGEILSNVKSSQIKSVIECGGVMTVSSIRLHSTAIHDVILESLKKANVKSFKELNAIAVTTRPGLRISLDIGLDYAKKLAIKHDLPLIPIHHMEAHALTGLICNREIKFPFLALLISGGHSQIALFKSLDIIFLLGNSIASGPGETIDKIARSLKLKNLGSPFNSQSGGQSVEMLAKLINQNQIELNEKKYKYLNLNRKTIGNCNFNFGSFRNEFRKRINKLREENLKYSFGTIKPTGFRSVDIDSPLDESCYLCDDLQINLANMFKYRLEKAIKFLEMTNLLDENVNRVEDIKMKEINYLDEKPIEVDLVVSGGVACNDTIMNKLEENLKSIKPFYDNTKFKFNLPRPFYLCTDNGTMIAWNGILKYLDNQTNYLLTNYNDINNVNIEIDAKLGIDITELIKKLLI